MIASLALMIASLALIIASLALMIGSLALMIASLKPTMDTVHRGTQLQVHDAWHCNVRFREVSLRTLWATIRTQHS